jgi:hypothetical protein
MQENGYYDDMTDFLFGNCKDMSPIEKLKIFDYYNQLILDNKLFKDSIFYDGTIVNPYYFGQNDPKWAKVSYSFKDSKGTIGSSACGPTSFAMVASTLLNREITPVETADLAEKNNFRKSSGTDISFFTFAAKYYGIEEPETLNGNDTEKLIKLLSDKKHIAIALMKKGNFTKQGHYIVILSWEKIKDKIFFSINDPVLKNKNYNDANNLIIPKLTQGKVKATDTILKKEAVNYVVFKTNSSIMKSPYMQLEQYEVLH